MKMQHIKIVGHNCSSDGKKNVMAPNRYIRKEKNLKSVI